VQVTRWRPATVGHLNNVRTRPRECADEANRWSAMLLDRRTPDGTGLLA
jgi:hypothetical protein